MRGIGCLNSCRENVRKNLIKEIVAYRLGVKFLNFVFYSLLSQPVTESKCFKASHGAFRLAKYFYLQSRPVADAAIANILS